MSVLDDIMADCGEPVLREQLGEAMTHHPDGGSDAAFTATFDFESSAMADAEPGGRNDARTGSVLVAKTQLASVTSADKITLRSQKWDVVTVDDRDYAWVLNIRRSVPVERGATPFRMARI